MRALPPLALVAAVGALLAIGLSGPDDVGGSAAPEPHGADGSAGPVLQHWDSLPTEDGFDEVFRVLEGAGAVPLDRTRVLVDGAPMEVTWSDHDGMLGPGDMFSFPLPAFDREHEVALEADGEILWSAAFGSGSGTPVDLRR